MATTSSRLAQLASQRAKFSTYARFQGARRTTGSLSSTAATIAKRTAAADLNDKVQKYNDGQISNADMLDFLQKMQGNSLLTPAEKVDVANKIRDFNDRIQTEKLQAVYKAAPDNSPTKVAAAQAISAYYKTQAAGYQPDTPAYSTALQNASQWDDVVTKTQNSIQTSARKLKRAELFRQVSNATPGSEDEASQKAQAYAELARQAYADGDQTEGLQFETQAQNALNDIPRIREAAAKKETAGTRSAIVGTINQLANDYHDGKITAEQFAATIPQIEQQAVALGDTSIQLTLNRWSDSLAKDIEKGVKRGTLDAGGGISLPTVLGKGGKGGTGASQTDWDQQDDNYVAATKLMDKWVIKGKDDTGKPYTYQDYVNDMALQLRNREETLTERLNGLGTLSPNARVYVNGKKRRVEDVVNEINQEMDTASGLKTGDKTEDGGIQERIASLVNNQVALVMQTPDEVSSTGNVKKTGRSIAKVTFVDVNSLDPNEFISDDRGIYHKIQGEKQYLKSGESVGGLYIDSKTNKTYPVRTDASGKQYIIKQQYVDVYEPGTSFKIRRYVNEGDKSVQGITDAERAANQLKIENAMRRATGAAELKPEVTPTPTQQVNQTAKTIQKQQAKQPGVLDNVKKAGTQIATAVGNTAGNVVKAAEQAVTPIIKEAANVVLPKSEFKSAEELNLPGNIPISLPPSTIKQPSNAQIAQPGLAQPPLQVAGAVGPSALQHYAKTNITQPIKIAAPNVASNVAQQAKPQQTLNPIQFAQQKIVNPLKNLAQKILPFKF